MKYSLQTILIVVLGYLAHQFFPFWGLAIVTFLVGLFFNYKNSLVSFMAGFTGGSLLWGSMVYFLNAGNVGLLSGQLGELFSTSGATLGWGTGLLGGLIGGMGAMTGALARNLFSSDKKVVA